MKIELESEDLEMLAQSIVAKVAPLLKSFIKEQGENSKNLMTVAELADYLNVSDKWIYQRVYHRDIPYFKLSGHLRFKKSEIEKWMASRKGNPLLVV